MHGIRFNIPVFIGAQRRPPVQEADVTKCSPAAHLDRAAVLLWAVNMEGKPTVSCDMVHLRGRLVVPCAPRPACIQAYARPLVRAQDHFAAETALAAVHGHTRAFGIYPKVVVIIAAWSPFQNLERLSAIR